MEDVEKIELSDTNFTPRSLIAPVKQSTLLWTLITVIGLSQAEIVKHSGINRSAISRMINGWRDPSEQTNERLIHLLKRHLRSIQSFHRSMALRRDRPGFYPSYVYNYNKARIKLIKSVIDKWETGSDTAQKRVGNTKRKV